MLPLTVGVVIFVGALAAGVPARGQTPKRGGDKRLKLVWEIQRKYNYGRMQEVWLDR